ncbi:hypothetical protein XENTR_v10015839 [Xenopus tropicalis]|nr:hypothetical protein XENTR_v10015839 [Xenopus tropicalis]
MGDGLSIIKNFLDNRFPDKGSYTCSAITLLNMQTHTYEVPKKHCIHIESRHSIIPTLTVSIKSKIS